VRSTTAGVTHLGMRRRAYPIVRGRAAVVKRRMARFGAKERETIEQFAKREVLEAKDAEEAREFYRQNSLKLAEEMPQHFFEFCGHLREAVKRFNDNCDPMKRMIWRESASLASRDPNPNADFNLTFNRDKSEITVSLNALGRSGKPPVFLIDINGNLKGDVFMARVEGQVRDKKIMFRITLNFKQKDATLQQWADRLVLAVVKQDYAELLDDDERI
jgi:hypothetical protein